MFKAIILLKRRDDTSHKEFADWWLGDHAPLAKGLPGVRGATFNLVAGDGSGAARQRREAGRKGPPSSSERACVASGVFVHVCVVVSDLRAISFT